MFRSAGQQLTTAAKFALYVERVVPLYAEMKDIQNTPVTTRDKASFAALARAKLAAAQAIPLLEAVLFPVDE